MCNIVLVHECKPLRKSIRKSEICEDGKQACSTSRNWSAHSRMLPSVEIRIINVPKERHDYVRQGRVLVDDDVPNRNAVVAGIIAEFF